MSLFRLKLYEFVTKPDTVKNLEKNALELVSILDNKQKVLAMFVKKLSFVNNVLVQGVNNYSMQMNTIKIGHHAAVRYLRILLNRYYINSVQIVDTLEDIFKCMSEVEDYKNRIMQYYMLHTNKPLELRYHLMTNPDYRNVLMRLLILMQRFKALYLDKTRETSKILMYMNNILELESKIVNAYKANPYKLTGFSHNARFIDDISKQSDYLGKLVNQFKSGDSRYEHYYKKMMSMFSSYKKSYDIPPIMQSLNHKDFGSYKHLYALYKAINLAIERQAAMLERELQDLMQRDKFLGRNVDPRVFKMSDPKMIELLSQKNVINKHISHLPQQLNLTISELEHCLQKGEGQVEQCIRKYKIAGGSKKKRGKRGKRKSRSSKQNKSALSLNKDISSYNMNESNKYNSRINKVQNFVNYLHFRQMLDSDNKQIREALRTLYKIQKELAGNAEMKEAINQAKFDECKRNKDYVRQAIADIRYKRSDDVYTDQMAYLDKLENLQKGVDPTIVGGNKPNTGVIKEISDAAWMDIVREELKKRNKQVYDKLKAQYATYIKNRLGEGSTKSMDQLLQEAFVQEIYNYVQQELKVGTNMSLNDLKNVTDGKIYPKPQQDIEDKQEDVFIIPQQLNIMQGMITGGQMFPKMLESALAQRLRTQEKVHGLFEDLTAKLMSLYGPSSRQYQIIQETINRAVADHKNEMAKIYYMNNGRLEREFLKADVVASRIREDLFSYIDLFPDYDSMCHSIVVFSLDLDVQSRLSQIELIQSLCELQHTYAVGMKKCIDNLEEQCIKELEKIKNVLGNLNGKQLGQCNGFDIKSRINSILQQLGNLTNNEMLTNKLTNLNVNLSNIGQCLIEMYKYLYNTHKTEKNNIQTTVVDNRAKMQKYVYEYKQYLKAFQENYIHSYLPGSSSIKSMENRMNLIQELIVNCKANLNNNKSKLSSDDLNKLRKVQESMYHEVGNYKDKKHFMPKSKNKQFIRIITRNINDINSITIENTMKLNSYKQIVKNTCDLYCMFKTVCVFLNVLNDNKTQQIYSADKFNEDIFQYCLDTSYYGVSKLTETNNTVNKFYMKLCEFKSEYESVYNPNINIEKPRTLSDEILDNCNKRIELMANLLLQKNMSKIQLGNISNEDKARNMQRLYQHELKLKTEKQHNKMIITNKMDKYRHIVGQEKMMIVSKINSIDNLNNLLDGGFKYIYPEAMKVYSCIKAGLNAYNMIKMICESEQTETYKIQDKVIQIYLDPIQKLKECVDNIGSQLYSKDLYTQMTLKELNEIDLKIDYEDLCDECDKPITLENLCQAAQNISSNYNISFEPDINCETGYNVISDLLAMEFV